MKIILTGASGFVGKNLLKRLLGDGYAVTAIVRSEVVSIDSRAEVAVVQGLTAEQDWSDVFVPGAVVIHAAARAHVMNDNESAPLPVYREINTAGTLHLARQAAAAGVQRFVFISSIKVNGESTTAAPAFAETDLIATEDPYAISKAEAEQGLWLISQETGMDVVIIRPPLVYGPGVKANFLSLIKLAKTAAPLPFGAIKNKRSMIYIGNLVDFIATCVEHPAAKNQLFLVSDRQDLSLYGLITRLRSSMDKPARLIPVPSFLFGLAGKLLGKKTLIDRLVGDLQVDSNKAVELLGWTPPFTVEQGIQATVDAFFKGK